MANSNDTAPEETEFTEFQSGAVVEDDVPDEEKKPEEEETAPRASARTAEDAGPKAGEVGFENEYYTITEWKGLANYSCKACSYSTTRGARRLMEHYTERHTDHGREERMRTLGLVGPDGLPLR